jgi:hypothetical protein
MGKKSRKKGGADKGTARKNKLNSRREQRNQSTANDSDDDDDDGGYSSRFNNPNQRDYFPGDRVWFIEDDTFEADNPNTYRGIVKSNFSCGQLICIISLQSIIDGDDNAFLAIPRHRVFPDFQDLTLRFNVGDRVVCQCFPWCTGTIQFQWPIREIRSDDSVPVDVTSMLPHYKCHVDWQDPRMEVPFVPAPDDDDSCIKLRPSSFRFKWGEVVDINPRMAEGSTGRSKTEIAKSTTWLRGEITAVDVSKCGMNYAVYECSFGKKKEFACRILDDNDENIARADADPRERLFDAIEQDCSRDHLIFLCSYFGMDVSTFRDLVVAKAIEFASYQALSWLQNDCNIDVLSMRDELGNNLLHQIAKSSHATRFIREAGRRICDEEEEEMLDFTQFGNDLHNELNEGGEIWLQSLIATGCVEALDAALSPHSGFAWSLSYVSAVDSLSLPEDPIMRCIFNSFRSFRTLC